MVRGIRGATRLERDDALEMEEAVAELVTAMLGENGITSDEVISVVLTATPDLHSAFPARALRRMGWEDVPLLCAQEIGVTGAMERVVRVLVHAQMATPRSQVTHIYLRGTESLRS